MMLCVDQSKRADIYQVAKFAFDMIGKPCPVRSMQVCSTSCSVFGVSFNLFENVRSITLFSKLASYL